jgi:hypothetical protein
MDADDSASDLGLLGNGGYTRDEANTARGEDDERQQVEAGDASVRRRRDTVAATKEATPFLLPPM